MPDTTQDIPEQTAVIGRGLTAVFALACGAVVGNIYYVQPLIEPISRSLHLTGGAAGLVVTLIQLGFAAGLLLLVPLADLIENRRLIQVTLLGAAIGLIGLVMSDSVTTFLIAGFLVGLCSIGPQILVPFAAHLAPAPIRGRVIGNIMGGLIAGIMLARPIASIVAYHFGWRAIFLIAAVVMVLLAVVLGRLLPKRQPSPGLHYGQILMSMGRLLKHEPVLRRRATYQGVMFASFSMFWTAVPLLLGSQFGLGQRGIALFALAGAGGALAAPLAGRVADRGWTRTSTALALVVMMLSFLCAGWASASGSLLGLVLAGIVLDSSIQWNQIVSQRAVYSLAPEQRGRLNAIYMTLVFLCGAAGSMLATTSYAYGGWHLTTLTGAGLGLVALAVLATEIRPKRTPSSASGDATTATMTGPS
jgi:predicted MFS family arabinose efflux permease